MHVIKMVCTNIIGCVYGSSYYGVRTARCEGRFRTNDTIPKLNFCIPNNNKKSKRKQVNNKMQVSRGIGRGGDSTIFTFSKYMQKSIITSTSAAEGLYGFNFQAGDLSEISSFTSIYDQYRIIRVELDLRAVTQPGVTATTAPAYAFLFIVNDFDDSVALASASLALNYKNVCILSPGQHHKRSIVPHVNTAVGSSSILASGSVPCPWLDCADTAVPHYGTKIAVTQSSSTNLTSWFLWAKYTIQFRMVR